MRLSSETTERIKQATDIVEVVGEFVSLKKRGANYMACCPFHNEKSPSFNVNPARQIYKCFGCGAAGDAIKFVMDIEGIGYGEAMKFLAQKYGIPVEEQIVNSEEIERQNERESLYIVLNFAQQYFNKILLENPDGQGIGLSYFRSRGFDDNSIKTFGLGYSLDQWDGLLKEATAKGFKTEILEKAGLTSHKEGESRVYDRFRGRVIFPIHNISGKVIAFGARILTNDKSQAKYLNSPETDVYHKSKILYGIFQAKNAIRQDDVCYLVEGYTDVVSLHQAGIQNVVASSGTSLTEGQIKLIGRFTQNITILYDGDAAGIKAALRGLDLVLEEGLNVSLVTLPDGEDPDSYVFKVGAEGFKNHVRQHTVDFISFKTEMLLREAGDNPFKRAEAVSEIVASISKIGDSIKRQIFFKRTAETLKVDEQTLISEGNKMARKLKDEQLKTRSREQEREQRQNPSSINELADMGFLVEEEQPFIDIGFVETPTTPQPITQSKAYHQEKECIRLLICYAPVEIEVGISLCHYVLHQLDDLAFETPIFAHILNAFKEAFLKGETLTIDYFLSHIDPEIKEVSINLIAEKDREVLSENWARHQIYVPSETDKLHELAFSNVLRLKKCLVENRMAELLNLIQTTEDIDQAMEHQRQFMFFKQKDQEIAALLGTVVSR